MSFFEQDSKTSVMGDVKVIREALVLEVLDRFLESNHVPFPRNVFFIGTFSASSRSRSPALNAEASLLKQTVGLVVVEAVLRLGGKVSSVMGITENWIGTA